MTRRTQVVSLLAMVAIGCLVQALIVSRAVVPALDAVRFVLSAQSINEIGLPGFLRDTTEPPLFPVSIWIVHSLITTVLGDFREAWALSAQLAAALPVILLPLPVFWLARCLVGPRSAMFGTMILVFLPKIVRLGADGISDSTHLLCFSVALCLLVAHLSSRQQHRLRPFLAAVAGVATALALLARTEAVLLVGAFGVVLLIRSIRRLPPWPSVVPYVAGLGLVLAPYALLLALASTQPTVAAGQMADGHEPGIRSANGEPFSFASKDPTTSIRRRGLVAALLQLAEELPKAFAYLPGILALVGFWLLRRRPVTDADLLLQAFCLLLLAAILFHTAREGYLAARHLLPIAVAATACLGVGAEAVARQLRKAIVRSASAECGATRWTVALTLAIAALCLFDGVTPLHQNRTGHRSAADWLARNAQRGDRVVDTRGWTGLYSGLPTTPYADARSELLHPKLRYVVIEDLETSCDSRRGRTIRFLLEAAATHVATFPAPPSAGSRSADVLVYQWDPEGYSESPREHVRDHVAELAARMRSAPQNSWK